MIDIKKHLTSYRWYHFLCEVAAAIFITALSIVFIDLAQVIFAILCLTVALALFIYACIDFIDMSRVLSFIPGSSKRGQLLIEVNDDENNLNT